MYAVIRYLARTPFGLTLQGVRDDPVRMSSLGYNVPLHRMMAFGFAGFIASFAGVIFVWWNGHIDPASINIGAAIDLLVIAVIGGLYRLEGAWAGALAFVVIQNYVRTDYLPVVGGTFHTLIGGIFLLIVLVSPGGLMGIWDWLIQHVGEAPLPRPRRRLPEQAWTHDGRRCRQQPVSRGGERKDDSNLRVEVGSYAEGEARRDAPGETSHKGGHYMTYVKRRGRRLWLTASLAVAVVAIAAAITATAAIGKSTATPIKFAIMSDCGGAFAANYEQDIGGAITAVSQFGGAKPNNQNKPSAGWHGGSIGGHPLKLVGIGCANDTADSAIKETKRLMEQLGADMMIGPLSGDESVAVANYAKQHPTKTFVNGTAGAWDTTAAVKAPNFFRFNGNGIQWQAGIGSIAGRRTSGRTPPSSWTTTASATRPAPASSPTSAQRAAISRSGCSRR